MSRGFLFAVGSGALWGVLLVMPHFLHDFSVIDIVFGRFFAFGILMLLLLWRYRRDSLNHLKPGDFGYYLQIALFGNLLFYFSLLASIHYLGAVPACILVGILPVWKPGFLIPGYDKLPLIISMLLPASLVMGLQGETYFSGIMLLLAAAGSWQVSARLQGYMALNRRTLDNTDHLLLSSIAILPCLLLLLPLLAIEDSVFGLMSHGIDYPYWKLFWLAMIILGLCCTLCPRLLWKHCVKRGDESLLHRHSLWQSFFGLLYWFLIEQRLPSEIEQLLLAGLGFGLIFLFRKLATRGYLQA